MKRRFFILIAVLLGTVAIGWLIQREVRDRTARRRAYAVVSEMGGSIGSITPPVPFAGSEIRIEFKGKQFGKGDLAKLVVLNPLTEINFVGVMFNDSNVSAADIRQLRELLPKCRVLRVVNGQYQDDP
jgi:hypothetical protein